LVIDRDRISHKCGNSLYHNARRKTVVSPGFDLLWLRVARRFESR
jgi:hypothetical protein